MYRSVLVPVSCQMTSSRGIILRQFSVVCCPPVGTPANKQTTMMINQLLIHKRSTKWSTIMTAQPLVRRLFHVRCCVAACGRPAASARGMAPPPFSVAMRSVLPVSAAAAPVVATTLSKVSQRMMMMMMTTAGPTTPRRLPTPPMPRTTYAVVISDATTTKGIFAQLQAWWNNGTILIALGWTALLTIVLDRYLQHQLLRQGSVFDSSSSSLNKEEMINELVTSTQQQRQLLYQQYSTAPALYQCQVKRYYKMGGSHGLYNVQLNDVLDVLVEHVGPKQAYHLCRLKRAPNANDDDDDKSMMDPKHGNSVVELGWYPVTHLEKYTPKPRRWWQRLLFLK